jgi:hypothetical protein
VRPIEATAESVVNKVIVARVVTVEIAVPPPIVTGAEIAVTADVVAAGGAARAEVFSEDRHAA